jgi:hypothetical protein
MAINDSQIFLYVQSNDFRRKGSKQSPPNTWRDQKQQVSESVINTDNRINKEHNFCVADNDLKVANNSSDEVNTDLNEANNSLGVSNSALDERVFDKKTPQKKSSQIIGEEIGTSGKKVEMCRAILDYASQKIKEQVIAGDLTILDAYRKTSEYKKLHNLLQGKLPIKRPKNPKATISAVLLESITILRESNQYSALRNIKVILSIIITNLSKAGWLSNAEMELFLDDIKNA